MPGLPITSLQYRLNRYDGIKPAHSMDELVDQASTAVLGWSDEQIKPLKYASVFRGNYDLREDGKAGRALLEQQICVPLLSFDTDHSQPLADEMLDVPVIRFILIPDLSCLAVQTPHMPMGVYKTISCLDTFGFLRDNTPAWSYLREAIQLFVPKS